jgi:hypothetical protein
MAIPTQPYCVRDITALAVGHIGTKSSRTCASTMDMRGLANGYRPVGTSEGPEVNALQSGFEHVLHARFAKVSTTAREKSGLTAFLVAKTFLF